ncbi:hypothetical protein SNEBB_005413 [Seison nebaliae]|nr:hypothetical protein SNEBB_005413 [Seison nebaliae]
MTILNPIHQTYSDLIEIDVANRIKRDKNSVDVSMRYSNIPNNDPNVKMVEFSVRGHIFILSLHDLYWTCVPKKSRMIKFLNYLRDPEKNSQPSFVTLQKITPRLPLVYINCNVEIFQAILTYLQTNSFHVPRSVCGLQVKSELLYWGFNNFIISQCCYVHYYSYQDKFKMLEKFEKHLGMRIASDHALARTVHRKLSQHWKTDKENCFKRSLHLICRALIQTFGERLEEKVESELSIFQQKKTNNFKGLPNHKNKNNSNKNDKEMKTTDGYFDASSHIVEDEIENQKKIYEIDDSDDDYIEGDDDQIIENDDDVHKKKKRKDKQVIKKMKLLHQKTNKKRQVVSFISTIVLLFSIGGLLGEEEPSLMQKLLIPHEDAELKLSLFKNSSCFDGYDELTEFQVVFVRHYAFFIIEWSTTLFFTIEFLLHFFTSSHTFVNFMMRPLNIIDFIALLPMYLDELLILISPDFYYRNVSSSVVVYLFRLLLFIKVIRVFMLLKVLKQYQELRILFLSFKKSMRELKMLSVFLICGTAAFGVLCFYAEYEPIDLQIKLDDLTFNQSRVHRLANNALMKRSTFPSISISLWWSIITMTTVGYGDYYPKKTFGFVVGVICAMSGVLLVALTIPIITNNFTLYYYQSKIREQVLEQTKQHRRLDETKGIDISHFNKEGLSKGFGQFM